jgi:hypothetical protein
LLFYSDEQRIGSVTKSMEAFYKPQWSPDLLLPTNYIISGAAVRGLAVDRAGRATFGDLRQFGE